MGTKLRRNFFNRPADVVSKDIIGKILVRKLNKKEFRARIVEAEAYFDEKDPASRAVQNGDLRKTMEMSHGTILVYGVHNNWLINFVTNSKGKAEAVLIRALEPLNFNKNCRGPGLLTKAIKIDKKFHKKNIYNSKNIWLEEDNLKHQIVKSHRIGIKKDLPKKLRFYIKNNSNVSKK